MVIYPEKESIGPKELYFVDKNGTLVTYEIEPMGDQIMARLATQERRGEEFSFSANDIIADSMEEVIEEIEKDGYTLTKAQESGAAARQEADDKDMQQLIESDSAQRQIDERQALKQRKALDAFEETTGHKLDFDDLDADTVDKEARDTAETKEAFRERVSDTLHERNKRWFARGARKTRRRIERGEGGLEELRRQAVASAGVRVRASSAIQGTWRSVKDAWNRRSR
jgi:hypothetical protein